MNRVLWILAIVAAATADTWAADLNPVNARNGAAVLTREQCNACHTIHGQGMGHEPPAGTRAPDLAEGTLAAYRPTVLASAMWNHTPDMWNEMAQRGVPPGALKAVIAGCESDYEAITELVKTAAPAVRVKRVVRARSEYRLEIVEYPPHQ